MTANPTPPIADVRREIERELAFRRNVYPKLRDSGKHKPEALDRQMTLMEQAGKIIGFFEQHAEYLRWAVKHRKEAEAGAAYIAKARQDPNVKEIMDQFPGAEIVPPPD